jgi:HlyD family secretion protein
MTPGELLLDVGNMAELEVSADVLTEDAVKISQGDDVVLFGESLGSHKLAGKVRLVEPQAFSKLSSLGVEEQRVSVKITLDEQEYKTLQDSGLQLGLDYGVRAKIITKKKQETAMIPRTSIFRGITGEWQVYKVVKGKIRLVDVGVGMLNDAKAEIITGLHQDDIVVIAPESSLIDGMKVQVEIKGR